MTISRRALLAGTTAVAAGALIAGESNADEVASAGDLARLGKTPHTKFAVNVEMWWTKLPFLDRLREAAKFGFPAVEFWPYQGKDIAAIKKLKERTGDRHRPVHRLGLSARNERPGAGRRVREDD
jgi:hydroxypyruvate isomerase